MRVAAIVLAITMASSSVARADEPVTVVSSVDPTTVTIGTPFRFSVEVTVPKGLEVVFSQPTERIGEFDILDFGDVPAVDRGDRTVITRWFQLAGYETGHKLLTSPPVHYRQPGGELTAAPSDDVAVTVESLLPAGDAATDIRDIKDIEPLPVDLRPYYLAGAALLALVLLVVLLSRFLRRSRKVAAPPPVPAHLVAYAELERLRARRLIEAGAFKEYYSALSDIVRTYLEGRFNVRAPEMTTEEFLATSARDGRLQKTHRAVLADFLTESDLVKFARHVPTIVRSERAYDAAKRFIDETAPLAAGLTTAQPEPAPPAAPADDDASRFAPPPNRDDPGTRGPHALR